MIKTLIELVKAGSATQRTLFPDLPEYSRGLPKTTQKLCPDGCSRCTNSCPTGGITLSPENHGVTLDLGRCIGCGGCIDMCEMGVIVANRSTRTAALVREDLVVSNLDGERQFKKPAQGQFRDSLHVREVSTGDPASDLEVSAADNPIFDSSRFGIHVVASPRFADALVVTGPVGLAMHEPLRSCYEAMAEPRMVIAAGAAAISGAPSFGGYAQAGGVSDVLPVDVFIPGYPPHPWYIVHGLLLAMGHEALDAATW